MHKLLATSIKQGSLTPKEAVVLRYLCEGFLRKEIADKVKRTESTVGKQIESIAAKLECHCSAEIVATAVALGLVEISVTRDHGLFIKFLSALLIINFTAGHIDMRRGPQAPRPARTLRTAGRAGRQNNRFIKGYEDESNKPSNCFTWPQHNICNSLIG
tara:strand:+ start:73967 stop:74443 length:477 start_codon:yes stop_codon:yes gene_type:complete